MIEKVPQYTKLWSWRRWKRSKQSSKKL